ncbi:MAG: hypothetical protein Fur0032_21970 [Terrimicrobiaceae bacterium]
MPSQPEDPPDPELVLLARSGDEVAFTRLFDAYYPMVRGFACRFLGDREAGEDVAQ